MASLAFIEDLLTERRVASSGGRNKKSNRCEGKEPNFDVHSGLHILIRNKAGQAVSCLDNDQAPLSNKFHDISGLPRAGSSSPG